MSLALGVGTLVGTPTNGSLSFQNDIWRSEGISQRLAPSQEYWKSNTVEERKVAEMKEATMPEANASNKSSGNFGFEVYA